MSGFAPASATTMAAGSASRVLRRQEAGEVCRILHGGREADGDEIRRQREEPCETERQQIAALRGDESMELVEDDPAQRTEQVGRVGARQQQRQLFRCRQQDVRRV